MRVGEIGKLLLNNIAHFYYHNVMVVFHANIKLELLDSSISNNKIEKQRRMFSA